MSAPLLLFLRLALAIVLYIFLGLALWVMWQDVRQYAKNLTSKYIPPLSLYLEQDNERKTFQFTTSEVYIGRDPASECRVDDTTISARHARLAFHHGQWWAEDLHSRNGTLLNSVPVTRAVVLTSGDCLQCGACHFSVNIGSHPELLEQEEDQVN